MRRRRWLATGRSTMAGSLNILLLDAQPILHSASECSILEFNTTTCITDHDHLESPPSSATTALKPFLGGVGGVGIGRASISSHASTVLRRRPFQLPSGATLPCERPNSVRFPWNWIFALPLSVCSSPAAFSIERSCDIVGALRGEHSPTGFKSTRSFCEASSARSMRRFCSAAPLGLTAGEDHPQCEEPAAYRTSRTEYCIRTNNTPHYVQLQMLSGTRGSELKYPCSSIT